MTQRLFLHIGVPKSGSTFLQETLGTHREVLKEHDHVYPFVKQEGMFLAAVEMAGRPEVWGLDPTEIAGTFAHLLRRGRRLGGSVVISHEIFASADAEQVAAIAEQVADFETHVVVTARDLGRTLTAQWQEWVKNTHADSFSETAHALVEEIPADPAADHGYWRPQNLARLVDLWTPLAPGERFHLVTCPPPGASSDLLWRRFAEAIDLDPDVVDLSRVPARNESLGTGQIALLRRVTEALEGRLEQPWLARVFKRWFAQTLVGTVPGERPVTPAPVARRLTQVTTAWTAHAVAAGVRVHGDLEDLLPRVGPDDAPHPDDVRESDVWEGMPAILAEMLLRERDRRIEIGERDDRLRGLTRERDRVTRERDDLAARLAEATAERDELVRRRDRWRARTWSRVVRSRVRRTRERLSG